MGNTEPDVLKVVVVGASGFGRESLDVLEAMVQAGSSIAILGVVDDSPSTENLKRLKARGIKYLGAVDRLIECIDPSTRYVLGIGNPSVRELLATRIEAAGFSPLNAIHPTAIIGTRVSWSRGVVICAGAVISTNVYLGCHVHVNPSVTIGHDSVLEDFVSVNPSAVISGDVLIKRTALVGAAATVLQGLIIGDNALIGACSCVTKDVQSGTTVKGIPAR